MQSWPLFAVTRRDASNTIASSELDEHGKDELMKKSGDSAMWKPICRYMFIVGVSFIQVAGTVAAQRPPAPGNRQPRSSYEGRDPNASWRRHARQRIERIRKADLTIKVVDSSGKPVVGATVDVHMQRHAFGFGSAVTARWLNAKGPDAERYRRIVADNYNKVVFENDLKWQPWELSKRNRHRLYRQQWLDSAFQWLAARDIEVRGHYVTWAPLDREQARFIGRPDALRRQLWAHMEEKLPAVGKRVGEWDAINHIIGWGETFASVCGSDQIYADIIKKTRQLAPRAELWVNEGQVLSGIRADDYKTVLQYLIAHDAAPDGIGFMGHFTRRSLRSPEALFATFNQFARLIPNLQLTEMDVDVGRDQDLQADYLRDVMTIAFSHPAFQAIVMWGFWEGQHWKPNAALYRRDWSIKPAGRVWLQLVRRDWWTDATGSTDARGSYRVRGFLGTYVVEVGHGTRKQEQELVLSKEGKELVIALD